MEYEQRLIDPEGKYPACGLRHVDQLALAVLESLPGAMLERTRDVFQINYGEEEGIVVIVTEEAVEFRLPTVEWTGGVCGPVPKSRLWKRVKVDKLVDEESGGFSREGIRELLDQAQKKRMREFRKCHFCGRPVPPEHRHYIDRKHVCHGCSEQRMGVVH